MYEPHTLVENELKLQPDSQNCSGGTQMVMAPSVVDDTDLSGFTGIENSRHTTINEAKLLKCLRAGEESCYEILVRKIGPQVMATAQRYLRSEADAADCFQDTFLAVFENINNFEQRSSLGSWIRGITINQCLMRIRKQARRREQSIELMLPTFDEHGDRIEAASPRQTTAISKSIDTEQMRNIVRQKINSLPDDYRLVLLLRDIDGYTTKETAAILSIRINAVKTRLHRARSALKYLLEPVLEQAN
jgi:RNA polymerase sigma-70 factor, ECF subfamily